MTITRERRFGISHCLLSLLIVLSTPALVSTAQLVGDLSPKLGGSGLVKALRQGGYIIYFRHGATDNFAEKDVAEEDLANCAVQRNLSDEGQQQTKQMGAALRALRIPIHHVYSSPYCRCLATARNLFGKAEQTSFLHFAIQLSREARTTVTQQLVQMLSTAPPPGSNTALVSHTANLQEAVGIWPKPEGVAHVFRPDGEGTFTYVGMMLPEAWSAEAAMTATSTASEESGWFHTIKAWFRNLF